MPSLVHGGDKWQVVDYLITIAGKVYVPTESPHLPTILTAVHDMRHEGAEKALNRLGWDFYDASCDSGACPRLFSVSTE
jgi:hypothetical protein